MARLDWTRARPRKPTLSIADEDAAPPPRRRFARRRGPKLTKQEMRTVAADAVREFEARKAPEPAPKTMAEDVPW